MKDLSLSEKPHRCPVRPGAATLDDEASRVPYSAAWLLIDDPDVKTLAFGFFALFGRIGSRSAGPQNATEGPR